MHTLACCAINELGLARLELLVDVDNAAFAVVDHDSHLLGSVLPFASENYPVSEHALSLGA
jgi:hypothetical protein